MERATKPPGNETTYVWEIENFSMCPQSKGECLKSTVFFVDSVDLSEYQLVLYPRGGWGDQEEDTPFCLLECIRESDCSLNVSMTIAHDGSTSEDKIEDVKLHAGKTIGFPVDFQLEKTQSEEGKFSLLPGELLTVRCSITPLFKDSDASDEDLKTLSEDLGRLRQMELFSDFSLIADGDRRFPVHKVVLGVRCRPLAKQVGMDHKEEGLMDDVSGDALDVFLHYVYTGRLSENLPSELLNEVFTLADLYGMDDLKRDLFPLELSTVGRTIVKIDHHHITWELVDFHQGVEWPVQTFVDLVIGRFVASFSLIVQDTGKTTAQIDLKCQCLNLDDSLTMKCVVKVSGKTLCDGEHRFDTMTLDRSFVMRGDDFDPPSDRVALVFDFKVSHPRSFSDRCHKMEVKNALPRPFWKRSLHRLSSDMDLVVREAIGQDGDKLVTFADVKVGIADDRRTVVPVHRCIMSARSSHLMSLVLNNSDPTAEIPLPISSAPTLFHFLRYVYSGKLSGGENNTQALMSLYRSTGEFKMEGLRNRCLQLLRSKCKLDDIVMLMMGAEALGDDQLMSIVVAMIRKDKDMVVKSEEWARVVKWAPDHARLALSFARSWKNVGKNF